MIFIVFGLLGLIASSQVNLKPETTALVNTAASENPNYPKALYPNNDCAVSNCYNGRCISPSVCLCDPYYANFPEIQFKVKVSPVLTKEKVGSLYS